MKPRYRLKDNPGHTTTAVSPRTVTLVGSITMARIPWWKFWVRR